MIMMIMIMMIKRRKATSSGVTARSVAWCDAVPRPTYLKVGNLQQPLLAAIWYALYHWCPISRAILKGQYDGAIAEAIPITM